MSIARIGVVLAAVFVPAPFAPAQTAPTFAKDVAPIFYSRCVECHRPTLFAPMSLLKYDDARPWARCDDLVATGVARNFRSAICR